jgi:hypothetical protein
VPVTIEQVTVGGIDLEELGDLLDQPLKDRLELQIARQCLGSLEQTALLDDLSLSAAVSGRLGPMTAPQGEQQPCGRGAACYEPDCEPDDERRGSDRDRSAEPQNVGCLCHLDHLNSTSDCETGFDLSVGTIGLLRLAKMGRTAYWKERGEAVAWAALGDANRGAFLALQSAVSN